MFHPTEHSYAKKKKSNILDLALFISDRQNYTKNVHAQSVIFWVNGILLPMVHWLLRLRLNILTCVANDYEKDSLMRQKEL